MAEMSEISAYKQLLEITENILNELSPEPEILSKYHLLKKSILSKTPPSPPPSNPISHTFLTFYKNSCRVVLDCIACFEHEIESQMQKSVYLQNCTKILKDYNRELKNIGEEIQKIQNGNKNIKLIAKEQYNGMKGIQREIQAKVENMGLMIQVHRKMHEIIMEASEKQVQTAQKQSQYNKRLNEMEDVVQQISDVKKFLEMYDITEKKAKRFDLARRTLAKVLFDS